MALDSTPPDSPSNSRTAGGTGPAHGPDTSIGDQVWGDDFIEQTWGSTEYGTGVKVCLSPFTFAAECVVCACFGMSRTEIREAAQECNERYDNIADRVACASRKAAEADGDCKAHAASLDAIIDRMTATSDPADPDIFAGTQVLHFSDWWENDMHILNWVRWEEDGVIYTYYVDAAKFPGVLVPGNEQSVPPADPPAGSEWE